MAVFQSSTLGKKTGVQLQYYFAANKVTKDDQKRAILLSNVAPSVFKLIRNILGDELHTATHHKSRGVSLPAKTL